MAKKNKRKITHQDIVKLFSETSKPLTKKEVYFALGVKKPQRQEVRTILKDLVRQGKLIRIGKAFGLVRKMPMVSGTLEIQRSGVGFVIPEDKRRKDIFIAPKNLDDAWHNDKVLVSVLPGRRGKNPEGRIVRILERRRDELTVKLTKKLKKTLYLGKPTDLRLDFNVMVDCAGHSPLPAVEDIVLVTPEEQLEHDLWSTKLSKIYGPEKDISVQEELVKANHDIPTVFPRQVVEEVKNLPSSPLPEDMGERKDLSHLSFVTIDGKSAKDFDDAIFVEKDTQGFTLWVAIADVSHYVSPGSPLDNEAFSRGNSYYFPQSVEPMFPEKLSNGLCSLVPGKNRLVMVAKMHFSSSGKAGATDFFPGVIKSHARLTYDQVKEAILDKNPGERQKIKNILPMLEDAEQLARILLKKRQKRGSLDFDLPEPEILVSVRDRAEDIRPRERHFGHQIIEEFMIAANEAVAEFLRERSVDFLYRIHPQPDQEKLDSLFDLLSKTKLGSKLPEDRDPKGLQQLLSLAEGTDLEFLVNRLNLRTMMQAVYSPDNVGHFGLASDCYCHFTSPIRRYADLTVHRAVKKVIKGHTKTAPPFKQLKKTGEHISKTERVAMEAEREITKRATILFLEDKVGQEYSGIVASLADFGFWVELKEVLAEGMVRLSSLTDDYYIYNQKKQEIIGERTGNTFHLGQEIKVVLENVTLSRLEVDLSLAG